MLLVMQTMDVSAEDVPELEDVSSANGHGDVLANGDDEEYDGDQELVEMDDENDAGNVEMEVRSINGRILVRTMMDNVEINVEQDLVLFLQAMCLLHYKRV